MLAILSKAAAETCDPSLHGHALAPKIAVCGAHAAVVSAFSRLIGRALGRRRRQQQLPGEPIANERASCTGYICFDQEWISSTKSISNRPLFFCSVKRE
jgi:hypothetical protein